MNVNSIVFIPRLNGANSINAVHFIATSPPKPQLPMATSNMKGAAASAAAPLYQIAPITNFQQPQTYVQSQTSTQHQGYSQYNPKGSNRYHHNANPKSRNAPRPNFRRYPRNYKPPNGQSANDQNSKTNTEKTTQTSKEAPTKVSQNSTKAELPQQNESSSAEKTTSKSSPLGSNGIQRSAQKELLNTAQPNETSSKKTTSTSTSSLATNAQAKSMPATLAPAKSIPATSAPAKSVPATSVPAILAPKKPSPATSAPAKSVPATSALTKSVPTTSVSATCAPKKPAPATSAPTSSSPTSNLPTTSSAVPPSAKAPVPTPTSAPAQAPAPASQPPPAKSPSSNSNKQQTQKTEKIDTNATKKSTKYSRIKRSDSNTSTDPVTASAPQAAAAAGAGNAINSKPWKGRQQQKTQNDTMQRNSSKASHTAASSAAPTSTTKSQQNNKNHNQQQPNDSSDSGVSSHNGQSRHHHQQQHHQNGATATGKQRKTRGHNKRQDTTSATAAASNAANPSAGGQQKRADTSPGFTVNEWLQNDMYCYERRFISSCGEDSRITRHNPAHRNSTSSEAAGSDDLNSSSSYESHCPIYAVQSKNAKKTAKARQKRQQKRKQQLNNIATNTASCSANDNATKSQQQQEQQQQQQPMDIDVECKTTNRKPQTGHKQHATSSSAASLNLRKQCTKAAALKAALNSSKLTKCQMGNALTTSPSSSSVCSSLSSASSTTSINSSISSSASSSPNHSVNSSPTASPTVTKRNADHLKKVALALVPPLRQFAKLNMNESQMAHLLRQFLLDPNHLQVYGFPVESVNHEGCIEIYKCLPKHMAEEAVTKDNQRHHHHYYGRKKIATPSKDSSKTSVINVYDGLPSSSQWLSSNAPDSGNASGNSSPRFTDSDSSDMAEDDVPTQEPVMSFYTPDGVFQVFSEYDNSDDKQCVRCNKMFQVDTKGEYQTFDPCSYHWGKVSNVYNGKCYVNIHSCCQGEEFSEGCSKHHLHVWNGCVVGVNGPYNDYVHTKPRSEGKKSKHPKIYAIDCEMSYTGLGLEVTKVTVVGYDGSLVYEHFVQPQASIVDYNTRFSGITEKDLTPDSNKTIKSFSQMQQDLLKLFAADTILIGHGLDNDLRALRLVHKTIVDTSLVFSHSTGFPYRRSLKNLTKSYLKRDIQCSDMGHSSFEDSRACLELMMWKLRKDAHHQWSSYQ